MAFIANFLNDKLQAREASILIDETMQRLKQRSGLLDKYMPLKTYDGDEFLAYVTERLSPVASIVAAGAEIPTSAHGTFRRITGELAKFALAYQFDEIIQKQMKKAMEDANLRSTGVQNMTMADGSVMKGTNDTLVKFIYGHIEGLVQAHVDLMQVLAWQVLQTGEINREDPRTRAHIKVDFKRPGANYNNFPPALVATGDLINPANNKWTDYENADGLQTLVEAMNNYIDLNGYKPDAVVMSWKLRQHLMKQKSTKEAARSSMVVPQVGTVSVPMLNTIIEAREICPLVTFDEFYQDLYSAPDTNLPIPTPETTSDSEVRNVRFMNENRFVFLKEKMGEMAMGTPLEGEVGLLGKISRNTSSVVVRVKEFRDAPPIDVCQSISTGLPLIWHAKQLYSQVVI